MAQVGVKHKSFFISIFILAFLAACQTEVKEKPAVIKPTVDVPQFNADSAYSYIAQQVAFGPRALGTKGHEECAEYLIDKMSAFTDTVIVQRGSVKTYDGKVHAFQNIIGSIKPELNNRILICAHWDTRPIADHDTKRRDEPILGANDGGSGVGVVLELARQLNTMDPKMGVDFILFDAEDYGQPDGYRPYMENSYCLGSQYWSNTPHVERYYARFGILLDMVGAENAKFTMEGTSMQFAPTLMKDIWNTASALGYSGHFVSKRTKSIVDDHLYINQIAGIPTIDIIEYSESTPTNFGHYWHTHKDNMDIIDRTTLKAVGQTVLTYVVQEIH
ncbi:MAG: M28 family peptidase [Bacteroidia bacterium]|nr:M28 family peptidase [Bacteroidia bacterium]NNC86299.1 M28 family peptidase [Bacteroidia bacterium]